MFNWQLRFQLLIVFIILSSLGVACDQTLNAPTFDPNQIVTNLTPSSTTPEPPPVSGHIADVSGKPIAAARVVPQVLTPGIPLPTIALTSNEEGYYSIGTLYPADYQITIEAEGYISETKQITFIQGRPMTLDFMLHPSK